MKYRNAQDILPKDIIKILQEYVNGEYLYIPTKENTKKPWGEKTGLKEELKERNKEIFNKYKDKASIKDLSSNYYLTESSIRRIIRQEKSKL